MVRRGEQTREHILDVAEHLYGDHGVAHVSLRQIRIAADQRNDAAVQYHFGDRDGILRALSERHLPRLQAIARRVADEGGTRPSQRRLVEAMVRPWAEYVTVGPSERAYVKIVAELGSDPTLAFGTIRDNVLPEMEAVGFALFERLATRLPVEVAGERVWTVSRFVIQTSADRARLVDAEAAARPVLPDDVFIGELVAMAAAALAAPGG
ncbi:MAG: hypothetical protein U0Q07_17085 [Acidimicrobiales bacterium]